MSVPPKSVSVRGAGPARAPSAVPSFDGGLRVQLRWGARWGADQRWSPFARLPTLELQLRVDQLPDVVER